MNWLRKVFHFLVMHTDHDPLIVQQKDYLLFFTVITLLLFKNHRIAVVLKIPDNSFNELFILGGRNPFPFKRYILTKAIDLFDEPKICSSNEYQLVAERGVRDIFQNLRKNILLQHKHLLVRILLNKRWKEIFYFLEVNHPYTSLIQSIRWFITFERKASIYSSHRPQLNSSFMK